MNNIVKNKMPDHGHSLASGKEQIEEQTAKGQDENEKSVEGQSAKEKPANPHMVSIIVPVHNAEKFITETIRSVCAQTYQDWELILVDDCSADHSVQLIREAIHQSHDRRIRLIEQPENVGAARSRNTGVAAAAGRYIAFLDADDLWKPQKLEHELRFMQKHDAAFVFSSYVFGDEAGKPTGKAVRVPPTLTYRQALTRTVIFTSTVLIDTAKTGKALVTMPDIPSEDTATWWRILQSGVVAYGLDEPLVIYRRSGQTLSSNKKVAVRRIWNLYRNIANLSAVHSAGCLLAWAWRASVRRIVDDTVRAHLETVKRFIVLQMSLLGIILHTALYAILWFRVYYPIISSPFISRDGYHFGNGLKLYFRGHLLVLLIYFILLVFLARNNGAMRTGYSKPGRILSAMVTALGITNLLTYFQLSLMRNWLLDAWPMVGLYVVQIILAWGWSYLCDLIYRHVFPARETLVISSAFSAESQVLPGDSAAAAKTVQNKGNAAAQHKDVKHPASSPVSAQSSGPVSAQSKNNNKIAGILESRQDRFRIMKVMDISEGIDEIEKECLSWYGCVVLDHIPEVERRELLNFCYIHYIRVYMVPEIGDLLVQGMDQMDALNIPMLEMREYVIDWEERVAKRLIDIIVAAVGVVVCSPFLIYGGLRYGIVRQPYMTKDGRKFSRHSFRGCPGAFGKLPMLLDVLGGKISLIGPEPLPYAVATEVNQRDPQFFYRVKGIKAGMTGYTQLLGKRFPDFTCYFSSDPHLYKVGKTVDQTEQPGKEKSVLESAKKPDSTKNTEDRATNFASNSVLETEERDLSVTSDSTQETGNRDVSVTSNTVQEEAVEAVIANKEILLLDMAYIQNFSLMQDFRLLLSVITPYRQTLKEGKTKMR